MACLALQLLKQWFGQYALTIEALKSFVVKGPRIRSDDSAALMALSDKLQNFGWAVIELNSN